MANSENKKTQKTIVAKSALLHSALEIVGELGLRGLTLAEVGRRAGYSRGLVQYHYGSKEALINEMIESLIRAGQRQLDPGKKGINAIFTILDGYSRARKEHPLNVRGYWVLESEMSYSDNSVFRTQMFDYQKYLINRYSELLIQEGISKEHANSISMLIMASQKGLILEWITGEDDSNIDQALTMLKVSIQMLVAGVKGIVNAASMS